jgi:recombinational DNA repair protein RecR
MNNTNQKRYYSPQFSAMASISVRRLAWAMDKSMPAAVDLMVKLLKTIIDPSKVCQLCKDKTKCQACTFSQQVDPEELTALEAVI